MTIPHPFHVDVTTAANIALFKSVVAAGGTPDDVLAALETTVAMVIFAVVPSGREAEILKRMSDSVCNRIAVVRIGDVETAGSA